MEHSISKKLKSTKQNLGLLNICNGSAREYEQQYKIEENCNFLIALGLDSNCEYYKTVDLVSSCIGVVSSWMGLKWQLEKSGLNIEELKVKIKEIKWS